MNTPKATKKSGYAYATEKLAKKEEELTETKVVMGGAMNLLHTNTFERNCAENEARGLKHQLQKEQNSKNDQYFTLMGRIVKYEPTAFDEILPYALENGCFWECDSKELGEYSKIDNYTTTTGKTYKAHFTIYGRFLQKCKKDDEAPISYKGYFLMKNYPDKFEVDRTKTEYKTIKDFIKIKSTPEPVIQIPEPVPIPECDTPVLMGGKWIQDIDLEFENGKVVIKERQNVYDVCENGEYLMRFLHPRFYGGAPITDWNAEYFKPSVVFKNPETKEKIWVVKDYDTTPKKKLAKNKIWDVNPTAENHLSAFGFIRVNT